MNKIVKDINDVKVGDIAVDVDGNKGTVLYKGIGEKDYNDYDGEMSGIQGQRIDWDMISEMWQDDPDDLEFLIVDFSGDIMPYWYDYDGAVVFM